MMVLVSYDVSTEDDGGRRRLRRVARACLDWGQRVQFSVFECEVDPAQWTMLRNRLLKEIDAEADSLRFYFLGANWRRRIEHVGAKPVRDPVGRSSGEGSRANRKRAPLYRQVRGKGKCLRFLEFLAA